MLTISAGHYGKGTGASGFIDEGQEVIFVVQELEKRLKKGAVKTNVIMDCQSKNQRQNLTYLVQQHNSTQRELDVSIHFNSSGETRHDGIGTEVLYVNSKIHPFAQKLSATIAQAGGFKNRGAKQRTDLALLNGTTKPAIIIEICFVNSEKDVQHYKAYQSKIFDAIVAEFINFFMPTPTSMLLKSICHLYEEAPCI